MYALFVKVAVENTTYSFDKLFTYIVPDGMNVLRGCRVTVPFGGGNKTRIGMVMDIDEDFEGDPSKLKTVISLLDSEPLLNDEMLSLAVWMKNRYFCTYFDALKLMFPAGAGYKINFVYSLNDEAVLDESAFTDAQMGIISVLQKRDIESKELSEIFGIDDDSLVLKSLIKSGYVKRSDVAKRKIGDAVTKMIRPLDSDGIALTSRQKSVWRTLSDIGSVSVKELAYFTGASAGVIENIVKKGAAEFFEEERYRRPSIAAVSEYENMDVMLSSDQGRVFDDLVDQYEGSDGNISLLYGVTGSGKTSVFLKLIEYVIGKGKEVILMVPEISLTPQTIDVFKRKFGDDIAVFHSGLSVGERLDEWKRAARGEVKIVIGTRSAVFAPFKNLGLIVIDEEQEHTYKSETSPRYHARDIAKYRVNYNRGFCLLCSATPSMESFYCAENGIYGFNSLPERYGYAKVPTVRVVNMGEEMLLGNTTDISYPMKKAIRETLNDGKQAILLLNRRGYNTFVRCTSCHEVVTCPNCSISLTYHAANNRLMCHYCGYSQEFTNKCSSCGQDTVTYSGYGTQRAEETLVQSFPDARILRIDADTVSAKYSLEKKLDAFAAGEYDIMIGTQMVAKGLNFENVTFVGVVSADQSLYSDDFRSNERTFDLLTQVIGRAGRGKYPGRAFIQTEIPENPYLRLAAKQDYFAFYEMEKEFRKAMLYPPYVDILVLGFVGIKEELVHSASETFLHIFSDIAKSEYSQLPLRVMRPSPAAIAKMNNKYRYKIIIKCKNTLKFRELVSRSIKEFCKIKEFSGVTVFADINPYTIL